MLRKDPFITGEYYHIYNRGIDKRVIFKLRGDYERFIMLLYLANSEESFRIDNLVNNQNKKYFDILKIKKEKNIVSIGAWCLMNNHFHILVRQDVDGGITKFMRKLGVGYSMFFNIKYQRKGALFGGLFKSKLVGNDDNYLRQLFAYIHLNPLEIEFPEWKDSLNKSSFDMKNFLESYKYSSYQDYVGEDRIENSILDKDNFPDYFHSKQSFREFVENYFSTLEKQT